mmetsp:Transcript_50484/g.105448  ORF Transcript_50484/g.105448 Transcript_50484/m.105448 type:complete len:202 (+) Transcript_50484:509-1114(+)
MDLDSASTTLVIHPASCHHLLHLHIRLKKLLLVHRLIQYSYEFLLVLLDRLKDLRRNRLHKKVQIKDLPTITGPYKLARMNKHLRKLLHQRLQHFWTGLHQSPQINELRVVTKKIQRATRSGLRSWVCAGRTSRRMCWRCTCGRRRGANTSRDSSHEIFHSSFRIVERSLHRLHHLISLESHLHDLHDSLLQFASSHESRR